MLPIVLEPAVVWGLGALGIGGATAIALNDTDNPLPDTDLSLNDQVTAYFAYQLLSIADLFPNSKSEACLDCYSTGSGKLETPIHSPDTRPYINPVYDEELHDYINPARPDEDFSSYTYIRPGVFYDPRRARYVTPIHETKPGDIVYNNKQTDEADKYEDEVREKSGGKQVHDAELHGRKRELDGVTDDSHIEAKSNKSVQDNPDNFLSSKRKKQIKDQIELAEKKGKKAEYWFKHKPDKKVVDYIKGKGGVVKHFPGKGHPPEIM